MVNLTELQRALGIKFNDPTILEQALVHGSYLNENPGTPLASNERLEFLGDAVLGLVISERLYQDFPFDEGEMTRLRSYLVRQDTLAGLASDIGLGKYLYLGRGEEASGGRQKPANLARALEAVIAAIFLDRGIEAARDFIPVLFKKELARVASQEIGSDYKSRLQELIQSRGEKAPSYHVIEAAGPEHDKTFTVEVRVGNTVLGRGTGKSKKLAESEAARAALTSFTE